MKYFFLFLAILALATFTIFLFRKEKPKQETSDNISQLAADDPTIKRYKDTAQAHIGYLIEFMEEHEKGDTLFRYFVKSNFQENGFNEHMWTEVYEFKDGCFTGTLANDPASIKQIKYHDTVKIRKQDVEDWRLYDYMTNTQVGGFSTDYLHKTSQ